MSSVNDLLQRIAGFSPAKRALLLRRLDALVPADGDGIARAAPGAGGGYPLSSAQERLWFVAQLEPDNVSYNVGAAVRIGGRLDVEVLRRALGALAGRHEALRTSFHAEGGEPVQRIADSVEVPLPRVDLAGTPADEREAALRARADAEGRRPFHLERAPLLRALLVRMDAEDHVLVLTLHHIVTDGVSVDLMGTELAALYQAFAAGRPSPLEPLPVRYVDYAAWQRLRLGQEGTRAQLAYWKERLRGLVPVLGLPLDRPRPEVLTHEGDTHAFAIPAALLRRLEAAGRAQGATLFMTLLASFQAVLRWYAGTDDLAVGSAISRRDRPELQGVAGMFVNTLVFRASFAGDPTFAEVLRRARKDALEAYANADVPFDRVVEEVQPERVMNRTPFFEATFSLEDARPSSLEVPGLVFRPLELDPGMVRGTLWLAITAGEEPGGLLAYNRHLFLPASVAGMAAQLVVLMEAAAARPEIRLSELDALLERAAAERRREREQDFKSSRREGLRAATRRPAAGTAGG